MHFCFWAGSQKKNQLNRLRYSDFIIGQNHGTNNPYATCTTSLGYKEEISYDANGNIKTLKRNGTPSVLTMDNLTYSYQVGNNRLHKVGDFSSTYTMDIPSGQADNNYTYDADGNLMGDVQEGHTMTWNARGKVQSVDETASSNDLYFAYDAQGLRVRKFVKNSAVTGYDYTYHVYDASGNIIATYDVNLAAAAEGKYRMDYKLAELNLYGNQRVGALKNYYTTALATATAAWSFEGDGDFTGTPIATTAAKTSDANFNKRIVGDKQFELSNHLGNVAVVVTDRKVGVDAYKFNFSIGGTHTYQGYSNEYTPGAGLFVAAGGTDQTIDYYLADVVSYADYYSFGMLMPDRNGNTGNYRYGFNGMEQDPEVKGTGNSYTTEFRQYDPRLGRWMTQDPIVKPWESRYAAFANNPIYFVDPSGLNPTNKGNKENTGENSNKSNGNSKKGWLKRIVGSIINKVMGEGWYNEGQATELEEVDIITQGVKDGAKDLKRVDEEEGGFWNGVANLFRSAERWINSFKGSRRRVGKNEPFVVWTADPDKKDQNPYGTGHLDWVHAKDTDKDDEMPGSLIEYIDYISTARGAGEKFLEFRKNVFGVYAKQMSNKELARYGVRAVKPIFEFLKDTYVEENIKEALKQTLKNDHVILPVGTKLALSEELELFPRNGGFRIFAISGVDSIKFVDYGTKDTKTEDTIRKISAGKFKYIDTTE